MAMFVAPGVGAFNTLSERAPAPVGFAPEHLAVIVNDADPLSAQIAEYYRVRRAIPQANMIHLRFAPGASVMRRDEFERLKAAVDARTPATAQAFALTWAQPYRVDCMSITTAFAAGFDERYCAHGCWPTRSTLYFDSDSRAPFTDFGLRPAMSLAAVDFTAAKALIDRGVAADGTFPRGTGYLMDTSDRLRNVRAAHYDGLINELGRAVRLDRVRADQLAGKNDVLFYFTGQADVPAIAANRYLPGAIADHVTSSGGQLTDSAQMSSLRWLEAGATGSYGAVVEPCNMVEKFPQPEIVIRRYRRGESLIEAYWKSVLMPGQGIFIGDPLARPFGGTRKNIRAGRL